MHTYIITPGRIHCFYIAASGNNETNECENMDNSFYLKIFWTSLAELPGTYSYITSKYINRDRMEVHECSSLNHIGVPITLSL